MTTAPTGRRHSANRSDSEDAGLGLIEIVVAMLMLAILAVAFLPLLVEGLKLSARNTTLATATQLVSEQMQLAQAAGPVCANVAALGGVTTFTDGRGVPLQVTTTTGLCQSGTTLLSVSAAVVRLDTVETITSASTIVYVGG
ncbi:type IV pilus modification PilV family protein [Salinibacterium soli]|uniref:Type II secretion system protein n=1 Tax=Antiquaquibacter soli TaxID=3064523 RepID=A0ABT9BQZ5_9MICO|nr:type II secretion system protein [Protaetiibacter sp. WY-16]MDO7882848.1 type II secretion system protein [Protaetiibacter sp. WY-16]